MPGFVSWLSGLLCIILYTLLIMISLHWVYITWCCKQLFIMLVLTTCYEILFGFSKCSCVINVWPCTPHERRLWHITSCKHSVHVMQEKLRWYIPWRRVTLNPSSMLQWAAAWPRAPCRLTALCHLGSWTMLLVSSLTIEPTIGWFMPWHMPDNGKSQRAAGSRALPIWGGGGHVSGINRPKGGLSCGSVMPDWWFKGEIHGRLPISAVMAWTRGS